MSERPKWLLVTVFTGTTLLCGCAAFRPPRSQEATLTVDQGSFRMLMTVDADGFISLAEHAPLLGRIDLSAIVAAEGQVAEEVQVVLHLGRYYITAEQFRNLWEVSPQPGEIQATYRPIHVSENPLSGVRMSRYGPPGQACVRLDADGGGPWYVTDKGKLRHECS